MLTDREAMVVEEVGALRHPRQAHGSHAGDEQDGGYKHAEAGKNLTPTRGRSRDPRWCSELIMMDHRLGVVAT